MQINNVHGVVNNTVTVPISITNDEEFISFQCDIVLPGGFNYISGSITLTSRSVDHVVNVTNIGNNTIRLLSYSLNNTPYLQDTGIVANFSLITPSTEGDYIININNGIIGNAESVNIIDNTLAGEINLAPIGVSENRILESEIQCFPFPFSKTITIQFDANYYQQIIMHVYNMRGALLNNHKLNVDKLRINNFTVDAQVLLGNKLDNGLYFIHFDIQHGGQAYSIVKKIQYKK